MSSIVLAVLDSLESAPLLLGAAQQFAQVTGDARVDALAIRLPPEATIVQTEEMLTLRDIARIKRQEHDRADQLKAIYDIWCQGASGLATAWHDVELPIPAAVDRFGSRADVIVLRRPQAGELLSARQDLRPVLFSSDRPVLFVPPGVQRPIGWHIAIAWRDDHHAVRAILAALRSHIGAHRVSVLAGVKPGATQPALPDILAEHGIAADLYTVPITGHSDAGPNLLAKAHELGADMLIMGAFTHSPLREAILGGLTRYMLHHADLPVFMKH